MTQLTRTRRIGMASRRGVAVTEFVICLPVLLLVLLGTIEICNLIFFRQSLETAAHEGARVAIIPGANTYDVEKQVEEIALIRNIRNVTVKIEPPKFDIAPLGTFITITVTAPRNSSFTGSVLSLEPDSASVSMMKEY